MPIYVFLCPRCEHRFEDLVPYREGVAVQAACPKCGSEETERQLTTFAVQSGSAPARGDDAPFCGRCGENRPPCT